MQGTEDHRAERIRSCLQCLTIIKLNDFCAFVNIFSEIKILILDYGKNMCYICLKFIIHKEKGILLDQNVLIFSLMKRRDRHEADRPECNTA